MSNVSAPPPSLKLKRDARIRLSALAPFRPYVLSYSCF